MENKFIVVAYDCKPYYYDNFLCKVNPATTGITYVMILLAVFEFFSSFGVLYSLRDFYREYRLFASKKKLEDLEK